MANLIEEHTFIIPDEEDGDGIITMREPTNKEWNDYTAERYPMGKHNKLKDNSTLARSNLFDKIVTGFSNIKVKGISVTMESKELLPMRVKCEAILTKLDEQVGGEAKN